MDSALELSDASELELRDKLLEYEVLLVATLLLLGALLLVELLLNELLLNEMVELLDSAAIEELDVEEFSCPSLQPANVNTKLTDPSMLMILRWDKGKNFIKRLQGVSVAIRVDGG